MKKVLQISIVWATLAVSHGLHAEASTGKAAIGLGLARDTLAGGSVDSDGVTGDVSNATLNGYRFKVEMRNSPNIAFGLFMRNSSGDARGEVWIPPSWARYGSPGVGADVNFDVTSRLLGLYTKIYTADAETSSSPNFFFVFGLANRELTVKPTGTIRSNDFSINGKQFSAETVKDQENGPLIGLGLALGNVRGVHAELEYSMLVLDSEQQSASLGIAFAIQ